MVDKKLQLGDDEEETLEIKPKVKAKAQKFKQRTVGKAKVKTSFEEEDLEEDQDAGIQLKRSQWSQRAKERRNKIGLAAGLGVGTSSQTSAGLTSDEKKLDSKSYLEKLKQESDRLASEPAEVSQEFIAVDPEQEGGDQDDQNEDEDYEAFAANVGISGLEEDGVLPIGREAEERYGRLKKTEMRRLVEEYQNDMDVSEEDDDDAWERELIKKGASKQVSDTLEKQAREPKMPSSEPLPTLDEVMNRLRNRLQGLEVQKEQTLKEIQRYKEETEVIDSKQAKLKESLQKSSDEYAKAQKILAEKSRG